MSRMALSAGPHGAFRLLNWLNLTGSVGTWSEFRSSGHPTGRDSRPTATDTDTATAVLSGSGTTGDAINRGSVDRLLLEEELDQLV